MIMMIPFAYISRYSYNNVPIKKSLVKGVLGVTVAYFLGRQLLSSIRLRRNKGKARQKRESVAARKKTLEDRLKEKSGVLLTNERKNILSLDIEHLLEQLKLGKLTPLDVLEAYQAKALIEDKEINAVCDFILEASEWASEVSKIPEDQRGPLFGLPVSVKECFFVKGYDSTIGLAKLIDKPAEEDCDFVHAIKELHGLPFCLTNVPQTMVSYCCSNPIFGNTANPHNLDRTPGGSSGGEAALIAAGGSLLGIGSDVGGSLRIPAHFSGVFGLKPTTGRIYEGGRRGGPGAGATSLRNGIYSVAGFMSSTMSGLEIAMQALLKNSNQMSAVDWRVAPVNWNKQMFSPNRKLKIGFYVTDGIFPPTPGVARAVDEVVKLLSRDGHLVTNWTPPGLPELYSCFIHFLLSDKGHHFLNNLKDEVVDTAITVNVLNYKSPQWLKSMTASILDVLAPKLSLLWRGGHVYSKDLWSENAKKDRLIYQLMTEWEQEQFDVVISPAFAIPAPPPKYCSRLLPAASYTCVYNLVGCPAGIVPVTKETAADQLELNNYSVSGDLCHSLARNATKGAEGCPIGVQVVGRHFQEEKVLHAMKIIDELLQNK